MLYTFILNHRIEFIFFYGITSEWTKQKQFLLYAYNKTTHYNYQLYNQI